MMNSMTRFSNLLSEIRLNTPNVRSKIVSSGHRARPANNHQVPDYLLALRTVEEAILEGLETAEKL